MTEIQCERISVVETVGDGTGLVDPEEITPSDLSVAISRPFGDKDENGNQPIERVWLAEDDFANCFGVLPPDKELEGRCDGVIVLVDVPIPAEYKLTTPSKISVEVTVSQIETVKHRGCPRCQSDLAETFTDGGCTVCGFYFDKEAVSEDRRKELDKLAAEYESDDSREASEKSGNDSDTPPS